MLYGYSREPGHQTVITAAIFKSVLADFLERASKRPDLYVSMEEPDFMTSMTDDQFKMFKDGVTVFEHDSAEQQQAFVDEFGILMGSFARSIDHHNAMLVADEPDPYDVSDERTLEEIHGLTENDPWDVRTDEEKEQDAAFKEAIKQAKKDGQISDESFKPREKKKNDKSVHVTDVKAHRDADGNLEIDRILAVKDNDASEQEQKQVEQAPTEPNATLTLTFGPDVKETRRVVWHGRAIVGAEDLIQAVHVDDVHKEVFRAGFQPDFMVEADGTGQITRAHYEIIFGELVCEHIYGEQSA